MIMAKTRISTEVPKLKGYNISQMFVFSGPANEHIRYLRKNNIKFRTLKWRHPKDKVTATLVYTKR